MVLEMEMEILKNSSELAKNSRKENRLFVKGFIEIFIEDKQKEKAFDGTLLNINSRAMAFMTNTHVKIEQTHFFSFILPGEGKLKNIKGKVIRQEKMGDEYLTVLSFLNIPKVEMLAIFKYIEKTQLRNEFI